MKVQGYGIILRDGKEYLSSFFSFARQDADSEIARFSDKYQAKVVEVEMSVKEK